MVWRDIMHVVYLGIGQDIGAGLIWDLWEDDCLESDCQEEAFKRLYLKCCEWCKTVGVSEPTIPFTRNHLGKSSGPNFPQLANAYKAAHVKVDLGLGKLSFI